MFLTGVALLLGIAACSGSEQSGTASTGMEVAAPAQRAESGSGAGAAKQGDSRQGQQQSQQQSNAPVQGRQLVQTARIELIAKDPFEAVVQARAVAAGSGGFTGQEESKGDRASITLLIPADRFDSAIDQLARLGRPTVQNKQASDVTEQVVDLDARLATQRASVDRMRLLLGKAQSVSEIAQIESELTRRESDLESLQGRRDALGGKIALSTVTLQVTKEVAPAAPVQATGGFVDGLDGGWTAFGDFWTVLTTALGAMLPFLLAVGIPVGLVVHFRRRRRRTAAAAAETS